MTDPEELAERAAGRGADRDADQEELDDDRDRDVDDDQESGGGDAGGDRELDLGAALMSTEPEMGLADAPDGLGFAGREFYIAGRKMWTVIGPDSAEEIDGEPAIVNIGLGVAALLGLIGPGDGADRDGDDDQESSGGESFEPEEA